uniref:Uncharacterized protein n=1 Tax=Triticum urartu TaxID=4572 RepID=A0A8R7P750_TRIUA
MSTIYSSMVYLNLAGWATCTVYMVLYFFLRIYLVLYIHDLILYAWLKVALVNFMLLVSQECCLEVWLFFFETGKRFAAYIN